MIKNLSAVLATSIPYTIDVNFVQCSLLAIPSQVVVDMQTNSLRNPVSMPQPSTQWATIQVNQFITDSYAWKLEVCGQHSYFGYVKLNVPQALSGFDYLTR
jgi:hypothetical protein